MTYHKPQTHPVLEGSLSIPGASSEAQFFSTDFHEVPLCAFSFDLSITLALFCLPLLARCVSMALALLHLLPYSFLTLYILLLIWFIPRN